MPLKQTKKRSSIKKKSTTITLSSRSSSRSGTEELELLKRNAKYLTYTEWDNHKLIGSGGFGRVYQFVKDGRPDPAEYVVKVVKYTKPTSRTNFLREGLIARKLKFPTIARTLKYFESKTVPSHGCIIMKFYPYTLKTYIRKKAILSSDTCLVLKNSQTVNKPKLLKTISKIWGGIILGVHYLHLNGLVYLDLKPDNIMCDIDGNIFLNDFGLSRCVKMEGCVCRQCFEKDRCIESDNQACTNVANGTPDYFSYAQAFNRLVPEMTQRKYFGYTSDIWTAVDILWGLLPVEKKERLLISPFYLQGSSKLQTCQRIVDYINHKKSISTLFGKTDTVRSKVLSSPVWSCFTGIIKKVFSRDFVESYILKCLNSDDSKYTSLIDDLLKPCVELGWDKQELENLLKEMRAKKCSNFISHSLYESLVFPGSI